MDREWVARIYRYADGKQWNEDRWELFVKDAAGQWVPVGGAIKSWGGETVAFLCSRSVNRDIHTPAQARQLTSGLWVMANSPKQAFNTLKWKYPDPRRILDEYDRIASANF